MRFNDLPERCKDCQNLKVWALDMGGNHAVTCKKKAYGISKTINATRKNLTRRSKSMTWGDLYKRFAKDYPKAKAVDYRPFAEGYLPTRRPGIIIWLENGDVLVYMPKVAEKKEE